MTVITAGWIGLCPKRLIPWIRSPNATSRNKKCSQDNKCDTNSFARFSHNIHSNFYPPSRGEGQPTLTSNKLSSTTAFCLHPSRRSLKTLYADRQLCALIWISTNIPTQRAKSLLPPLFQTIKYPQTRKER